MKAKLLSFVNFNPVAVSRFNGYNSLEYVPCQQCIHVAINNIHLVVVGLHNLLVSVFILFSVCLVHRLFTHT